jgi:hypothetical protein
MERIQTRERGLTETLLKGNLNPANPVAVADMAHVLAPRIVDYRITVT